jgi:hypothetical protein
MTYRDFVVRIVIFRRRVSDNLLEIRRVYSAILDALHAPVIADP